MASFSELWTVMEESPLMGSGEDSEAIEVVRAGKHLRKEDDSAFWDEFISLCGNTRGLANLLNVAPEKISNWPAKIKEALEKLETNDAENPGMRDDTEQIPTGNNGAFTSANVDPNLGDMR
jgi:hypothetical protein